MVHGLRERHEDNAVGNNPLVVSLRYRCECANNEVLQISTVLNPATMTEQAFIWTMRQLWRDVQFEVKQHIEKAENATNKGLHQRQA